MASKNSKLADKKRNHPGWTAKRIYLWLVGSILVLVALHLLLQAINLDVYHQQHGQFYELSNRFDLDDESSVPTWFSLVLYLIIAVGAGLARYLETSRSVKRLWLLIGGLAFLFSLDEASGIHEYILQTVHVIFYGEDAPTGSSNAWRIVLPFVLAAGVGILWKMYKLFPRRTMLIFGAAGVVFLTGAIGIDLATNIAERENFLNQGVMVAAEESLELLATATFAFGVADYIETRHRKKISNAVRQLRDS